MTRDIWPVREYSIRPAGDPDKCFYCQQPIGEEHTPECVIRSRTVVIRTIIENVVKVPEDWDAAQILMYRNHSTRCANNTFDEWQELVHRLSETQGDRVCFCSRMETAFVREATMEDEAKDKLFVSKLPS